MYLIYYNKEKTEMYLQTSRGKESVEFLFESRGILNLAYIRAKVLKF